MSSIRSCSFRECLHIINSKLIPHLFHEISCASCPYCHGKAYIEAPCLHTRISLHPTTAATSTATPSIESPPWVVSVRQSTPPSPPKRSAARYQHQHQMAELSVEPDRSSTAFNNNVGSDIPPDIGSTTGRKQDQTSPLSRSSLGSTSSLSSSSSSSMSKGRTRHPRSKKGSGRESRGGNGGDNGGYEEKGGSRK